jgi:hypothetical protein
MPIRYIDLDAFDDPATAAVVLAPDLNLRREKEAKRKLQRHPGSESGRGRGRPRLTEDEAAESRERRLEYRREWFRAKRAHAHEMDAANNLLGRVILKPIGQKTAFTRKAPD